MRRSCAAGHPGALARPDPSSVCRTGSYVQAALQGPYDLGQECPCVPEPECLRRRGDAGGELAFRSPAILRVDLEVHREAAAHHAADPCHAGARHAALALQHRAVRVPRAASPRHHAGGLQHQVVRAAVRVGDRLRRGEDHLEEGRQRRVGQRLRGLQIRPAVSMAGASPFLPDTACQWTTASRWVLAFRSRWGSRLRQTFRDHPALSCLVQDC